MAHAGIGHQQRPVYPVLSRKSKEMAIRTLEVRNGEQAASGLDITIESGRLRSLTIQNR
jgi:hypothetical protein